MKQRPPLFLRNEIIDHNSEVFDYITELHGYLWKFVRIAMPGASGTLDMYVDAALKVLENSQSE